MRRLLPTPLMSVFLFGLWLALNQSVAPGELLLGAALGIAVPLLTNAMRPLRPRVRRPVVIVRLFIHVLIDITRSCANVAGVILGKAKRRQRSGFMSVPLDMRDPHGLAVLSAIINSTPGTVWAELSADRKLLMIHVLDLHDEQWWTDTIKTRYEKPLMAIFE